MHGSHSSFLACHFGFPVFVSWVLVVIVVVVYVVAVILLSGL